MVKTGIAILFLKEEQDDFGRKKICYFRCVANDFIRQKEEDASIPYTSLCSWQGTCSFLQLCWGRVKQGEFTTPWRWRLLTPWLWTEAGREGRLDFWKGFKQLTPFSRGFWGISISKLTMLLMLVTKKSKGVECPSPVYRGRHRLWEPWSELPHGEVWNCIQLSCAQILLRKASHFSSFWNWCNEPSSTFLFFHCQDSVPWKCFVILHAWLGLYSPGRQSEAEFWRRSA